MIDQYVAISGWLLVLISAMVVLVVVAPSIQSFLYSSTHAQHRDESDARSTFMQLNWSLEYTNTCNITEGTLEDDKI